MRTNIVYVCNTRVLYSLLVLFFSFLDEASVACDDQKESKIKDVLSKEAQSMLVDLARDSSGML